MLGGNTGVQTLSFRHQEFVTSFAIFFHVGSKEECKCDAQEEEGENGIVRSNIDTSHGRNIWEKILTEDLEDEEEDGIWNHTPEGDFTPKNDAVVGKTVADGTFGWF